MENRAAGQLAPGFLFLLCLKTGPLGYVDRPARLAPQAAIFIATLLVLI